MIGQKLLSDIPIDFQTKSKTNQNIQCQKTYREKKESFSFGWRKENPMEKKENEMTQNYKWIQYNSGHIHKIKTFKWKMNKRNEWRECSILLNLYITQTDQVAKHRKMDRIRVSIRKYKKKRVKKRKKNLSQQFVKKEIANFLHFVSV